MDHKITEAYFFSHRTSLPRNYLKIASFYFKSPDSLCYEQKQNPHKEF